MELDICNSSSAEKYPLQGRRMVLLITQPKCNVVRLKWTTEPYDQPSFMRTLCQSVSLWPEIGWEKSDPGPAECKEVLSGIYFRGGKPWGLFLEALYDKVIAVLTSLRSISFILPFCLGDTALELLSSHPRPFVCHYLETEVLLSLPPPAGSWAEQHCRHPVPRSFLCQRPRWAQHIFAAATEVGVEARRSMSYTQTWWWPPQREDPFINPIINYTSKKIATPTNFAKYSD